MRAKIQKKIEEIRQKPEHVRVMYVWGAVGIIMFFVFVIWVMTLQENFRRSAYEVKNLPKTLQRPTEEQSIENMSGESSLSKPRSEGESMNLEGVR